MFTLLRDDSKVIISGIFFSVVLVLIDSTGILNIPKGFLQQVTIPVQYGLYKSSQQIGKQFSFLFLARRAVQENDALQEQLAQVLSENSQLQKKLAETQAQLDQQQTQGSQNFSLVAARPIGLSRYLILDKGSDEGLKKGQTVIFKDNYIGQLKDVSPKKSTVSLSTDPDAKMAAFALDKDGKAQGILLGQFGSEMLLDKVLHEEPFAEHDLIYTGGTEEQIPRGLIAGQIQQTIIKDGEVFKQAKVKPLVDVANLDLVFVITN